MQKSEELRQYLNDMNHGITDSYAKYNIFKLLHEKIKTHQKVFDDYNIFFTQLYFGFRDLTILSFSKLFDKNSKKINIYKLINFIKINYKILNRESKEFYKKKGYEEHKNILFKDIEKFENYINKNFYIIKKFKSFRDKRISHNDKESNFDNFEFKEIQKIYELITSIVNEIDLYFFSNSIDNCLIKEDIEMDIDEIFQRLNK